VAHRAEGLLWFKATPRVVDLITASRKTQTVQNREDSSSENVTKSVMQKVSPKRLARKRPVNPHRLWARLYVSSRRQLSEEDWERLFGYFRLYLEDTEDRFLLLRHRDEEDRFLVLPYAHRFLKRRLKEHSRRVDVIFAQASESFSEGVFLTLTMDPKRYSSLVDAMRKLSLAWNRFMSRLRKVYGFRPPYIRVLEFQDSGNPHLHVVLFGVSRIGEHRELTEYFKRIGFGEIHYEYKIVKIEKDKWVWANPEKGKPSNATHLSVKDYIKKYIKKQFDYEGSEGFVSYETEESGERTEERDRLARLKISAYFALNARFYTASYSLLPPKVIPKVRVVKWAFVSSFHLSDAPEWVVRLVLESDAEFPVWFADRVAEMLSLAYSYGETPLLRVVS